MLSIFDIFATPVTLNYRKKSGFSTTYSLIISIFMFIIFLATMVYFSRELFNKSTPEVSSIATYPRNMNITVEINPQNFLIEFFFPINDDINKYFKIKASNYDRQTYESKDMKIIDCTKEYPERYDILITDQTWCLERTNVTLSEFSALSISVFRCENETDSGIICKSDEEIRYRRFVLRTYTRVANPVNYSEPFIINQYDNPYILITEIMQSTMFKLDVLKMDTDDGMVIENSKIDEGIDISEQSGFTRIRTDSAPLLTIEYLLKGREVITKRKYKKLQDVLANVGGIFPFLRLVGRFLVGLINPIMMNLSFVNNFFAFSDINLEDPKKAVRIKKFEFGGNLLRNRMKHVLNKIDDIQLKEQEKQPSVLEIANSVSVIRNICENNEKLYNDYVMFKKITKKRNELKFSFSEILISSLCPSKYIKKNYREKKKCLHKINEYVKEKTDILTLVSNSRELDLIKNFTLTKNEQLVFKNTSKVEFKELGNEKVEEKWDSFGQLFNYYRETKNEEKTEKDCKLLKIMDKDIVFFFEEKINQNKN